MTTIPETLPGFAGAPNVQGPITAPGSDSSVESGALSGGGWREVARFWVDGVPRPGGSKKGFTYKNKAGSIVMKNGRPLVGIIEDGKHTAEWRQDVKAAARGAETLQAAFRRPNLLSEPLAVGFRFVMPRLKSHFDSKGRLRPNAPHWHQVKPDLLKLIRSTEDACTGILWVDDAQTVRLWPAPEKVYGDRPGCEIVVSVREGA